MAWVRIDDQVPRHHKHVSAGSDACWLWVCGIAHCQSQLTDGFIPHDVLPMIGVTKNVKRLAERLVAVGLFDRVEGGYHVHDYLEHNQSRSDVLKKRAEDTARKRGGVHTDSDGNPDGIRKDSVDPPRGGVHTDSDGSPSGFHQDSVDPPRARAGVPSHPIPSVVPSGREDRQTPLIPRGLHKGHATCGRPCVPTGVHEKLVLRLALPEDEADNTIRAWYRSVQAAWEGCDIVPADDFQFWTARFDEWKPAPVKPRAVAGKDYEGGKAAFIAGFQK